MKPRIEFKKSKVGSMAIKLDRLYYAPGDVMNGTVLFNCTQVRTARTPVSLLACACWFAIIV